MSIAQLKERLHTASHPERIRLLGKILRETRDTDVWQFTSPGEIRQLWPDCQRLTASALLIGFGQGDFVSAVNGKQMMIGISMLISKD